MSISVKSKKANTGKLYSNFILKVALKYLQTMQSNGLIGEPFPPTKYTLE
jgi:hypothetical protein